MASSMQDRFQHALSALQKGKTDTAERLFRQVLQSQPKHVGALNLLSILLTQLGRFEEAETYARRALGENASSDATHYNYGVILKAMRRPAEALECFGQALRINPTVAETWNNRGATFNDLKRYREAIADFDRAIAINSNYADAFLNKGNALADLKNYAQSLAAYEKALTLKPGLPDAWVGRGKALAGLEQFDGALAAYDRALSIAPELAGAWLERGNLLAKRGESEGAFAAYDRALRAKPDLAEAWNGRGNVFCRLEQPDDASAAYDRALELKPDLAEAWVGRGNIRAERKQYESALEAYAKALAAKPDLVEALLGRGKVFTALKDYDKALLAYDNALVLNPESTEALVACGDICTALLRYDHAYAAYNRALGIRPDLGEFGGYRLLAKLYLCEWSDLDDDISHFLTAIRSGEPTGSPLLLLAVRSSHADQLRAAKSYISRLPSFPALWSDKIYTHDRIRLAYLSSDFRDHPVTQLIAGLFEEHDKSLFEVTAISYAAEESVSEGVDRIRSACDRFIDVRLSTDEQVADMIQQLEIDIAIDLNGITRNSRPNILSRRPAPVQVNYLGYAGTMGAEYIDYLIADSMVVPRDQFAFFSEKVVWLPDSFMVNDSRRRVAEATPTRSECALPEKAFVFCCFNNAFKIAPDIFKIWMRLLKATPNSVLWLSETGAAALANLRREVESNGVSPDRLIVATRVPSVADHLARLRQADLFLDTLPYNAHTTAADALWVGVPVLTCPGEAFAGRVAASLNRAIGLSELIVPSLEEYEKLALALARDPARISALKVKLAHHRRTYPLFDTNRFARNIEAAYRTMWERYQHGERPQSFAVELDSELDPSSGVLPNSLE
jgi:protein O-GlcNAc transferase